MPEVIEVKKYTDFIRKKMKGKLLKEVNIINGRYKKNGPFESYSALKKALPLKILDIESKGKLMYFVFENNMWLLCTLGLSGGWLYRDNKMLNPLSSRYNNNDTQFAMNHLNVEFNVDAASLYFYDTLSFGTMKIVNNVNDLNKKLNSLGPDIISTSTTFDIFKDKLKKKINENKHIGNVLMNQKIISGIGNYLRADTLWLSKISPFRKVKDLSDGELLKIYNSVRFLIWSDYNYNKGVKLGIVDKKMKLPSDYKREFFVYNQTDDVFGNTVVKEELHEGSQKRFIYWVPELQK